MIFKRLATLLKGHKKSELQPSDKQLALTREFESVANSLVGVFGKDFTDYIIESWRHNESSLAIESLINNLTESEPPLSEELQERIAAFAEMEDRFNEQRWQKHKAEITPEEMKKYDIKDFRTHLLAEFREVYPKGSSRERAWSWGVKRRLPPKKVYSS